MREFVRGWRRKVGCLTLAMACLLTAAWVRSFVLHDVVVIPIWNSYTYVVSVNGELALEPTYLDRGGADPYWVTLPYNSDITIFDFLQDDIEWIWRGAGLAISKTSPGHTTDFIIHYAWLTLPLTLLSAYLILWKPKPRVRKVQLTVPESTA
ncbi:MAG: hypothetical protein JWP89_3977 [Schlesneria sp.]|nr:hypothetical protein [Schlesneria sp.]